MNDDTKWMEDLAARSKLFVEHADKATSPGQIAKADKEGTGLLAKIVKGMKSELRVPAWAVILAMTGYGAKKGVITAARLKIFASAGLHITKLLARSLGSASGLAARAAAWALQTKWKAVKGLARLGAKDPVVAVLGSTLLVREVQRRRSERKLRHRLYV